MTILDKPFLCIQPPETDLAVVELGLILGDLGLVLLNHPDSDGAGLCNNAACLQLLSRFDFRYGIY